MNKTAVLWDWICSSGH